jgi:hypothetical protein
MPTIYNQPQQPREKTAQEKYWSAKRKQHQEYQAEQQLKADAIAEAQAEAGRREAEAERVMLEAKRQDRQTLEAYDGLTPDERARFDQLTNPQARAEQVAQQARAQLVEQFERDNAARRQQEMQEWRTKTSYSNNTPVSRARALAEINASARERAAAFQKSLEDAALQAEKHEDPLYRIVHSLPEEGRKIMSAMLDKQPGAMDTIQQIKQGTQQEADTALQAKLRPAFEAEIAQARGISWKANIRAKYREMGLHI